MKPFKTGVLQESKNIMVLQYQAGFMSNQMCKEGFRVMETMGNKIIGLLKYSALRFKKEYGETL